MQVGGGVTQTHGVLGLRGEGGGGGVREGEVGGGVTQTSGVLGLRGEGRGGRREGQLAEPRACGGGG